LVSNELATASKLSEDEIAIEAFRDGFRFDDSDGAQANEKERQRV
jgi:hypothetical protein